MKKRLLLVTAISISLSAYCQKNDFEKFISYFSTKNCPYEFKHADNKEIPENYALAYLCNNDSSLLTWKSIGMDQESSEVIYEKLELYQYKGYAKFELKNFYMLIYNEYNVDGLNEFTSICNIGIFSKEGDLIDELPFYIYDETGKYTNQTGSIIDDCKIQIEKKEFVKNNKGIYTRSYRNIILTYKINEDSGKFMKINEEVEFVDKSKK